MEELEARGGARIGWVNASWPLAKLTVSATRLRLSSLLGIYDFAPQDVVSFEYSGTIPFFSTGIRIVHVRADYPAKIIFWTPRKPEVLIKQIREFGFTPSAPPGGQAVQREFPARGGAVALILLAWCGLFLLDRALPHRVTGQPVLFVWLALMAGFLVCWGAKRSASLQKMILKDGHSVNEIKAVLSVIQVATGILLAFFTLLLLVLSLAK